MQLLIGTNNPAKKDEFKRILSSLTKERKVDLEIVFPTDLGITEDVEETGETFAENSLLKARFYFDKTGVATIADDGGIIISALGNEPGVKSKRWLGREATDEELINYTLKRLEEFKTPEQRKCSFQICLTFYDGKKTIQVTGENNGTIGLTPSPRRIKGFPYRALVIMGNGKYYDDLTPEEHQQYNHREAALSKLWFEMIKGV